MKKKPVIANGRVRSTNLELLGGVNSDALRALKETAARADLPLARVFRDVLAIGLSVVTDPEESPYHSLIAFRQGLAAKALEYANAKQTRTSQEPDTPVGPGSAPEPVSVLADLGEDLPPAETGNDPAGSLDALERPGFGPEDETDSVLELE